MRLWGRAIDPTRKTQRAPASRGLLALLLVGASTLFAACGDDGEVAAAAAAGNAGRAAGGHAGAAPNTSGSSNAGAAHAGAAPNGGAGSGGRSGNGGRGGSGGNSGGAASRCEIIECFRANVCLDNCGGKVVSSGCCPCSEGTVEELSCEAAGGQAGSG